MSKIDRIYSFILDPLERKKAVKSGHLKRAGKFTASLAIGIISSGLAHFTVYKLHKYSLKKRTSDTNPSTSPSHEFPTNDKIWTDYGHQPYDINTGKPLSRKKAHQFHQTEAKRGNPHSAYYLAWDFEDGIEGEVDLVRARKYYLAAARHDSRAACKIAEFLEFGLGGERDLEEARKYYKSAALRGDSEARLRYGYFLAFGIGGEQDLAEAENQYKRWRTAELQGPNAEGVRRCQFCGPFEQQALLNELNNPDLAYPKLRKVITKYDGLCELICNQILMQDLLGNDESPFHLMQKINLETLNAPDVISSHTAEVHSRFAVGKALLLEKHPDNIFSEEEQKQLITKNNILNEDLISGMLNKLDAGETLKVHIFQKKITNISGHSLLIKKIDNDRYIFFDPDLGEFRGISSEEVMRHLADARTKRKQTNAIFFTRGSTFLERLKNNT